MAEVYEPYFKVLEALRAAWDFIENVSEDDPNRSEKFFALRERVRGALPSPAPPGSCVRCNTMLEPGKAMENTLVGIPDFIGDPYPVTVSPGGPGKLIDCLKCPTCGYSVYPFTLKKETADAAVRP